MHSNPPSFIVAAFDFDNTLTDRDSFLPFLFSTYGKTKCIFHLICLFPYFILFSIGIFSRQSIKEKIITKFLANKSIDKVAEQGQVYAAKQLDHYLKPEALACLQWHLSQGHRCLLVSASLDFYLKPWARRHGFENVLSSTLEIDAGHRITGRLIGKNCWGIEKQQRLNAYLGSRENYQLYAYGDSEGDKQMLEMADYPFYRQFPIH